MKIFQIQHDTKYTYSNPVVLGFHTLHLRPISHSCQQVMNFQLMIHPQPTGMSHFVDIEGNPSSFAWFSEQKYDLLSIQTQMTVHTLCHNPFDYLCTYETQNLPIIYTPEQKALLHYYLLPFSDTEDSKKFAHQLANTVEYKTLPFLDALNNKIVSSFTHTIREIGTPLHPDELLATRQGACRDFTYLFINSCRLVGIAARFVSGYQENTDVDGENHLHAWVEVYLPHAGWRGYDPSIGLAVSDGHIALAAGANADMTMPIIGSFQGQADSKMDFMIQIMHTEYE